MLTSHTKHMHGVARTPTPPPTNRVPQSPTDRFIQRRAATSHHAAVTPQTNARKTRHTRSALVKFFADRPSKFRGEIDTTAHPEANKYDDWADFVKRVFKDEVARAVKKEAQQEIQNSKSSRSESTTPCTWVIDKGTPKSFENGRAKLASSIAARQACSLEVIKRTGIGSLLDKRDETILRDLIEGNFVTEKKHRCQHPTVAKSPERYQQSRTRHGAGAWLHSGYEDETTRLSLPSGSAGGRYHDVRE
jgi:hypothetical protein